MITKQVNAKHTHIEINITSFDTPVTHFFYLEIKFIWQSYQIKENNKRQYSHASKFWDGCVCVHNVQFIFVTVQYIVRTILHKLVGRQN